MSNQKNSCVCDWHPADIVAAVKKTGTTMTKLSRAHGLAGNTLQNALRQPWPKGEKIIAEAISVPPEEIWPTRYAERALKQNHAA